MQIKNKIILIIICTFSLSIFNSNLHAEEFNISALEFFVDKKNNIVIGKGDVVVTDTEGKIIKADILNSSAWRFELNIDKLKAQIIVKIILFLICMY